MKYYEKYHEDAIATILHAIDEAGGEANSDEIKKRYHNEYVFDECVLHLERTGMLEINRIIWISKTVSLITKLKLTDKGKELAKTIDGKEHTLKEYALDFERSRTTIASKEVMNCYSYSAAVFIEYDGKIYRFSDLHEISREQMEQELRAMRIAEKLRKIKNERAR